MINPHTGDSDLMMLTDRIRSLEEQLERAESLLQKIKSRLEPIVLPTSDTEIGRMIDAYFAQKGGKDATYPM